MAAKAKIVSQLFRSYVNGTSAQLRANVLKHARALISDPVMNQSHTCAQN